ncbi:DUF4012 domain-containing protein [Cryobacterium sp. TMT2-15-1]|uniref:DUF4012 domain-containing protein n=1 Tax=Cryobacterium sp. TMT2-15-1 TaxID=1259246 RepID=UPI00106D50F6|nr:DUF4012 domain-containing protein [Cryobacterium sp. TMT2-15-1]TFC63503.1 DUF4012 domain-containing protein [Cryobacterium sp. TMT2-15-1]
MSEIGNRSSARRSLNRRRPRVYRHWWIWTTILVGVLMVAGAWVGVRGLQAEVELEAALPLASTIKAQLLAGDSAAVSASVESMAVHTVRARDLTGDPVWRAAEFVPFAGANLAAVRNLADVADDVVSGAAVPLAATAANLNPASLKPVDGAVDLKPIVAAGEALNQASTVFSAADKRVSDLDTSMTVEQVTAAVGKFHGFLGSITPALESASQIVDALPGALGETAPRNYVIVFQNNAEARALGGTSLSFALLTIDKGHVMLGDALPAGLGNFAYYQESVIPLPEGVEALYGSEFGRAMSNLTVRPSFESGAETAQEMWKRQFGTVVDGVISIDPVALGYLLRGTEPIPLSTGDVLTSDTLMPLLLNGVYMRYKSGDTEADNAAQDAVYAEIVVKTVDQLLSGDVNPQVLLSALTQAASEHRVLMWSPRAEEQAVFSSLGVDGALPVSDKTMDRVGVYFQENVGSKMNYYLKQSVSLGQAACRADGKASYRVGVDLTNGLPVDAATAISPSILGQYSRERLAPGIQRMLVMVYAPPGSQIVGATVDGASVQLESFHDTDYPVAKLIVSMEPGATSKITLDVVAAATGTKALEAEVTPMVNPTTISDLPLDCATVAAG